MKTAPTKSSIPETRIIKADFEMSAPSFSQLPEIEVPEIAFLGRSNVGKSSLLNALCDRRALARVSKTPGRTQTFNLYPLEIERNEKREHYYFVDLPGFGYARIDQQTRRKWEQMIESYLLKRDSLSLVLLLVDSRRVPAEEERWIAKLGRGGNLAVIMTKSDKLSTRELANAIQNLSMELKIPTKRIMHSSILRSAKTDIPRLRNAIFDLIN